MYGPTTRCANRRRTASGGKGGSSMRSIMTNSAALAILLLAGIAGVAGDQLPAPGDSHQPEPFRLSVNVDMVVLHAAVRDKNGHLVSDLTELDFEVYEDGVRQAIRTF